MLDWNFGFSLDNVRYETVYDYLPIVDVLLSISNRKTYTPSNLEYKKIFFKVRSMNDVSDL